MNRRDALMSTGAMFVSASLGALACGTKNAVSAPLAAPSAGTQPPPGHHHHGGDPALVDAAADCIKRGEACLAHCIALLSAGDKEMADCARTVNDMRSVMHSLHTLAHTGSKHLPEFAKVAMKFCQDCEAACRKHAAMHAVCKDCADACAKTVAACQKAAG
ncbi:MAG: four-helix bundle copper-binding protein [Myxococcales bacterium]|nr:four-helix bundle copper-binding protein [Myxococcales bacterium]